MSYIITVDPVGGDLRTERHPTHEVQRTGTRQKGENHMYPWDGIYSLHTIRMSYATADLGFPN